MGAALYIAALSIVSLLSRCSHNSRPCLASLARSGAALLDRAHVRGSTGVPPLAHGLGLLRTHALLALLLGVVVLLLVIITIITVDDIVVVGKVVLAIDLHALAAHVL